MKPIVIITGASSGIGLACAQRYAAEGYHLIITGRRQDRIMSISKSLSEKFSVENLPLVFDVQNRSEVEKAFFEIPEKWKNVDLLINNAGLALGRDNFEDASIEDWDCMLQTNVHGLLYVTRAVLPWMINKKKGHIINIGSIAAKQVYEAGNVYCASKSAVDAISHAMRIDLLKHNIKVTAIHPGAVETEFSLVRFKGNEDKAKATYIGYKPLMAEDIAETCWYCSSLPEHVCINDLVITCRSQADAFYLNRISS